MTFRELIEQLAKRIGQNQLPVNTSATEMRALMMPSAPGMPRPPSPPLWGWRWPETWPGGNIMPLRLLVVVL